MRVQNNNIQYIIFLLQYIYKTIFEYLHHPNYVKIPTLLILTFSRGYKQKFKSKDIVNGDQSFSQ